jgi:hypothetical protein
MKQVSSQIQNSLIVGNEIQFIIIHFKVLILLLVLGVAVDLGFGQQQQFGNRQQGGNTKLRKVKKLRQQGQSNNQRLAKNAIPVQAAPKQLLLQRPQQPISSEPPTTSLFLKNSVVTGENRQPKQLNNQLNQQPQQQQFKPQPVQVPQLALNIPAPIAILQKDFNIDDFGNYNFK